MTDTHRAIVADSDPFLPPARRSASVLVLRDSARGPELLMLRRQPRAGDMRSAVWVFPGGIWDAEDATLYPHCNGAGDAALSARMGVAADALSDAVCAIRECYEEVGVLFATNDAATLQAALAERVRGEVHTAFVPLVQRHGLRLDAAALHYHSHWLTPPGSPQRFNTRFFAARLPAGQTPEADEAEAQELRWFTAAEAVQADPPLRLVPVTFWLLEELVPFASVDAILDHLRTRTPPPREMPRLARGAGGKPQAERLRMSHPAWAEVGWLDAGGAGTAWPTLEAGRVVQLTPRLRRITCGNGSVLTGAGTNTYLLADPESDELTVLDPGPLDIVGGRMVGGPSGADTGDGIHGEHDMSAHLAAVRAAAGGQRITQIVVTHTHPDHSPAVRSLAAQTGARVIGRLPTHPEWQDASFKPDHQPEDGERIRVGAACHLRAITTPGHASNHVCWLLEEDGIVFTGDQVMQGSTVVINPPDGDMGDYIASLEKLAALAPRWFAPGHGFLMPEPVAEVRRLVAHRLAREARVLAALQAAGRVTAAELVPAVYGPMDAVRLMLAERSLTAHLIKLARDGRALQDGAAWSAAPPAT